MPPAITSVEPLRRTLEELIDFDQLNHGPTRLTVGASRVRTAEMRYFNSRDMPLALDHVMASGALPPAFPAVRIDGELYWDGGILSNTPVEVVFDDNPRRDGLVFAVHIWNPHGPEPETMWEVMNRQKDVQYSSRAAAHIKRQRQLHRMRHIIAELSKMVPEDKRRDNRFGEMASYGCLTRMHVVRLLAPALDHEDHSKDIDFSAHGIRRRREAGYDDTMKTLEKAPWRDPVDEIEGFILHEASGGQMVETAAAADDALQCFSEPPQRARSPSCSDRCGATAWDRARPRLVVRELERRGHEVHLVDPLELQLPLLDRMYKEHPAGEAPGAARAARRALPQRRRVPGRQRRI